MMATDVVDAHVHVWDADRAGYPWLAATPQLHRAYELADVAGEHAALGVGDVVLVQAADNVEDSENMLRAATDPRVAGVVVWAPLHDVPAMTRLLDGWRGHPVVGVRHLVHREPDPDWLLRPAVQDGLAALADRNLTFDVCAESEHLLGLVPELARRHPGLSLVVDHLGKPPIAQAGWQPWADLLAAAASCPRVTAKVSGLNTAAAADWSARDLRPYVEHALRVFESDRLMYGGDWPFALQAAESYGRIWRGIRLCLDGLTTSDLGQVLSGTARRVYGLRPASGA